MSTKAKILFIDIETSPIISYTWGLRDQNVAINQIKEEWHILSYSAKWQGDNKIYYYDQRKNKVITDDKKMLEQLWDLLDEADIIVGHNSKSFDVPKIQAKLLINGIRNGHPPSSFKQIDTYREANKHFELTSNKLEYIANALNCKAKKLTKRKFEGFSLWKECLNRNQEAWKEMELYNKQDIIVLEEVYNRLLPWNQSINFSIYNDGEMVCGCGNTKFKSNGKKYLSSGIYQRYKCTKCGHETRGKQNLIGKDKARTIKVPSTR